MLILILTSTIGGELKKIYERNTDIIISPVINHVPSGVLVWARVEGGGVAIQPTPTPEPKTTEEELVYFYSEKYGVNPQLVFCVIEKESSWNTFAVGDSGKAKGLAQFWLNTYQWFRRAMGLSQKDERTDKAEAIKTLCYALSIGRGNEWTPVKTGVCK